MKIFYIRGIVLFSKNNMSCKLLKSQKKICKTFPTALDHCVLQIERFSSAGRIQSVGCSFPTHAVSCT